MIGQVITIAGIKNPEVRRDVFISYRRDGGDIFAKILDDRLEKMTYHTFFDVDHLRSGKFNGKLNYFIENCQDFLLVLPKNALDRCSDPNDWLRLEIECAIQSHKNIIPIMLHGFEWPDAHKLPESLRDLYLYNALQQPSNEYFDASIVRLTQMMQAKPLYLDAKIIDTSDNKPWRLFLERLLVALAALAIGIGGTLLAQRLFLSGQASNGTVPSGIVSTAQLPQATATDAFAYVTGLKKGGAIDQAIRKNLGIADGAQLLLKDVESITAIDLSGLTLTDIGELSALTGLKTLDLHNNKITDLTPLSALTKLETLLIYNNRITSLQPLSGMVNLAELSAEDNQITDVSPLAGLTTLKKLYLQNNRIVDVSPIKNLVNLSRLVLDGNPVTDYTPLRNFDTTVFQMP